MISLVSGMTALIAVLFGRLLSEILPIAAIQASGGTLLAVMGVKALWQIKKEKEKTNYDLDLSQKIETWEAVWMGTVLSADSFLVGIGLVQYGNQAYAFPALVTVLTGGFLILAQQIRYWRIFDYFSYLLHYNVITNDNVMIDVKMKPGFPMRDLELRRCIEGVICPHAPLREFF